MASKLQSRALKAIQSCLPLLTTPVIQGWQTTEQNSDSCPVLPTITCYTYNAGLVNYRAGLRELSSPAYHYLLHLQCRAGYLQSRALRVVQSCIPLLITPAM